MGAWLLAVSAGIAWAAELALWRQRVRWHRHVTQALEVAE